MRGTMPSVAEMTRFEWAKVVASSSASVSSQAMTEPGDAVADQYLVSHTEALQPGCDLFQGALGLAEPVEIYERPGPSDAGEGRLPL